MRTAAVKRRGGRAVLALLVGLLVGAWAGGGLVWFFNRTKYAEPGEVVPVSLGEADEVRLVPADAVGFVHVRLDDLWKTDAMAEFRKVVGKAGEETPESLRAKN